MRLQLVTGFVGAFDTSRDYTLQLTIVQTRARAHARTSSLTLLCTGFNDGRFFSSVTQSVPGLSYQLVTATVPHD
jgi:hypothetical protein